MNSEQLYDKGSPMYQALKELVKEAVREVLIEFFGKDEIPDWEKEDEN